MNCRFCQKFLTHTFLDLHHQPPSNSFLTKEQLEEPEVTYPLTVYVCDSCWLVQVPEIAKASEIFSDEYPYYSSASPSNAAHAKEYVEMMCERFGYGDGSKIMEIGSNDGYLLQWFKEKGCEVRGWEPARGPYRAAHKKGIRTIPHFFNSITANFFEDGNDLICGVNVLAHQPDINDFLEGLRIALKPGGVVTMEFPHLMRLVEGMQFDTIYHEHYSYFSFGTVYKIFQAHGLEIFDVEELPTHGGSLRIYAEHAPSARLTENMARLIDEEGSKGMFALPYYQGFQPKVENIRGSLLKFLISKKRKGLKVCAYGAAAKGNTLLNYCGIHSDLISYVVDISPAKQGKYLPGSHIPVVAEEHMANDRPDYMLILPWNIKEEIMQQLSYLKTSFVTAIPNLKILEAYSVNELLDHRHAGDIIELWGELLRNWKSPERIDALYVEKARGNAKMANKRERSK